MIVAILRRERRFVDVALAWRNVAKVGTLRSSHFELRDDALASRMHAVFEVLHDRANIIDLGSTIGTQVNGEPVNKAAIEPGDVVGVGKHELTLVAVEPWVDDPDALVESRQQAARSCGVFALAALAQARLDEAQHLLRAGWWLVQDPQWLGLMEELRLVHGAAYPDRSEHPTQNPDEPWGEAPTWLDADGLGELRELRRALLPAYRARHDHPRAGEIWQARTMEIEVGLAPGDDVPRQVYADWLLERGDPRGEFIALQLITALEPEGPQAARAAELWRVHGPRWSAEFAELGAGVEFRRGFPWRVTYGGSWPDELIALVRDRPTIERVGGPLVPHEARAGTSGASIGDS